MAAGFSAESRQGYTFLTLCNKHACNLRWAEDCGDLLGPDLKKWLGKLFERAALERIADTLSRSRIDESPTPHKVRYDYVLPFGDQYDRDVEARFKEIEPIRLLRKSLPAGALGTVRYLHRGGRAGRVWVWVSAWGVPQFQTPAQPPSAR